jgi:F-type H+-transporting ATPase subunit delta
MTEYRVSTRYARALLETAVKGGFEDIIYTDFLKVREVFGLSDELFSFVSSPVFPMEKKKAVMNSIFSESIELSQLSLDFLQLLIDKRRGGLIKSIIIQYENQYNVIKKRLPVEIESAIDLSDPIKATLLAKITDYSKQTVLPEYKVNTDLKGGLRLRIGDWVFDASIKNQLEVLYKKLAEGQAS